VLTHPYSIAQQANNQRHYASNWRGDANESQCNVCHVMTVRFLCMPTLVNMSFSRRTCSHVHQLEQSSFLSLEYPTCSHQAITITLHFQTLSKDTLLPVSLSCHLTSIHQRALIVFIQTLALYKSFTYLLTYLLTKLSRSE